MNIVNVKTYKRLPLMSFEICFNKMAGFYLSSRSDLAVNEEKIYGNHEVKVNKVLNSFKHSDRNLGVILSGQKGIGKSLFARILSQKAIDEGYPVLLANTYMPGIADFISSIEQEVVVIFDEFEKNFASNVEDHAGPSPQEEMLSLFDGLDNGKKLFVITCNEVDRLNVYLLNRPGRFHYHFKITYPTEEEIVEYLTDKIDEKYADGIKDIVNFSRTVNMTYDYLRAIAFELNQGYGVAETLEDLNISQTSNVRFNIAITTINGDVYNTYGASVNLFNNPNTNHQRWYDGYASNNKTIRYALTPDSIKIEKGMITADPKKIEVYIDPDDFWTIEDSEKRGEAIKKAKEERVIKSVVLTKVANTFDKYLY